MKYLIGIVAVVGFCSTVDADVPVTVAAGVVSQTAVQKRIVDNRLSVTLCDCESDEDNATAEFYLTSNGDFDFLLKPKYGDNSSGNPMIVQSRKVTAATDPADRVVTLTLYGLKDNANPVGYDVDVCTKDGSVLGSYSFSNNGDVEILAH
ncbi:hypothetical protein FACS189472_04720 [Alphaproteobacteria bacterium]|nr:hypothetical protein FACS189472_04720 [Alphaproteobacteria bacterium]